MTCFHIVSDEELLVKRGMQRYNKYCTYASFTVFFLNGIWWTNWSTTLPCLSIFQLLVNLCYDKSA